MYELNFDGPFQAIPQHMRDSIQRYCVHHIKPGSFLSALLQNDLQNTIFNADEQNLPLIKLYLQWFHTNTSNLLGKENFQKWIANDTNNESTST